MAEAVLEADCIGQQVRALRKQSGMSIRQLAVKAGVTAAIISCIERDKNSPSIATLSKILNALQTNLQNFFGGSGVIPSGPILRREDMRSISDQDRTYIILLPGRDDLQIGMLDEHLNPDCPRPVWETLQCDISGYLLSGSLQIELPDEEPQTLRPGDAFYFKQGEKHRCWAVGDTPARVISACHPAKY